MRCFILSLKLRPLKGSAYSERPACFAGAACGQVCFTADAAIAAAKAGNKVVLVRLETSPEDIEGMYASQGILTVRGGMTSHAAVVARGMGTCCVAGCGDIVIDEAAGSFSVGGKKYHEGDYISLDGSTGNVYGEAIPTVDASVSGDFGTIMGWGGQYPHYESAYKRRYSPRRAQGC